MRKDDDQSGGMLEGTPAGDEWARPLMHRAAELNLTQHSSDTEDSLGGSPEPSPMTEVAIM